MMYFRYCLWLRRLARLYSSLERNRLAQQQQRKEPFFVGYLYNTMRCFSCNKRYGTNKNCQTFITLQVVRRPSLTRFRRSYRAGSHAQSSSSGSTRTVVVPCRVHRNARTTLITTIFHRDHMKSFSTIDRNNEKSREEEYHILSRTPAMVVWQSSATTSSATADYN